MNNDIQAIFTKIDELKALVLAHAADLANFNVSFGGSNTSLFINHADNFAESYSKPTA
jgi:hypothetical protein